MNCDGLMQIVVKPHALFERDGSDLLCAVPIGIVTSFLGGPFFLWLLLRQKGAF